MGVNWLIVVLMSMWGGGGRGREGRMSVWGGGGSGVTVERGGAW